MKANFVVLITLALVSLVYTAGQNIACKSIEDPSAYSHCEGANDTNNTHKCCYLPEKYECEIYSTDDIDKENFGGEEAQCGSDYLKMFALALFAVLF